MSTVSRGLPKQPHLDVPKRQARELLRLWRTASPEALERIRRSHPRFQTLDDAAARTAVFRLADAQLVIAREYGFKHWTELKQRIEAHSIAGELNRAIRNDDRTEVVRILRTNPGLLHIPVVSGNWGPPMSHAANLGRLEIIQAVAQLGAKDYQHAFDRALLQGQIECARWLHSHGAKLVPGIVMGVCETLNVDGLLMLLELQAPLTDERGDRLAPLALAIGTYGRNPGRKHAILDLLSRHIHELPDTPVMAFHRGQLDRLQAFIRRDPGLLQRRFTRREIYPPELGCPDDERAGLHGTPLHGTTLLHLAIDYAETEIFDLLLEHGADVDARATIDDAGFGGHTPLFNAVVSCPSASGMSEPGAMTRTLLARGASPGLRTTLRKFLDWCDEPGWHEAVNVTAAEWAEGFPEKSWISDEALQLLRDAERRT